MYYHKQVQHLIIFPDRPNSLRQNYNTRLYCAYADIAISQVVKYCQVVHNYLQSTMA